MTENQDPRAALAGARRIVVKIGTRAIVDGERPGEGRFGSLADQVAALRVAGHTVALVSSGAVALGIERLGLDGRPRAVPQLQAAASVGQSRLIQAYEEAFAKHDIPVGQVLLTHAGMADRKRYLNARASIDALFELGTVPVINENDAVSTEEIEFGDNDQLAAMVASLVGADLLVILTDVDGLLDANDQRVSVVRDAGQAALLVRSDQDAELSLGGMGSKVGAADRATQRGLPVVIAPAADPDVLAKLVRGEDVGTLFLPTGAAMASRQYWIAHTLKMNGTLVVDDGAGRALTAQKRSLLAVGVQSVRGDFRDGDAVSIEGADGTELARGLVRYDARDVERLCGARSDEIASRVGHYRGDEIVHRDDLVVL